MTLAPFRTILLSLLILFVSLASVGCGNRPAAAQRLFDKGEYQAVIDKYPELEIARRAKAMLAEKLFEQKDYQGVLKEYADTPAAYKAKQALAQDLFDKGQYRTLIDSFPTSTQATMAKERLADSLFAGGYLDSLIKLYPETPRGKEVKETRAAEDLKQAKKLRGAAQKTALEAFMSKYSGTAAYKEAGEILSKIRQAEANKKK